MSNYNRMSDQVKSIVFALVAIVATLVLAKLLDLWLAHRKLPPEAATRWQTLRHLDIPAALPVFLGGLRIGATLSVIGVPWVAWSLWRRLRSPAAAR